MPNPAELIKLMRAIGEIAAVPGASEANIEELLRPERNAGVAQSGERLPRKQEAAGSIPVSSSTVRCKNGHELFPSTINESGWTHNNAQHVDCDPTPCNSKAVEQTGLTYDQQKIVANIVHHRVGMEDNRKALREAQEAIEKGEKDWKKLKAENQSRIESSTRQGQYHMEQMKLSEEALRLSILNDALIKGIPPEPEKSSVEEHEELGRAD